jgi:hypothetical protein
MRKGGLSDQGSRSAPAVTALRISGLCYGSNAPHSLDGAGGIGRAQRLYRATSDRTATTNSSRRIDQATVVKW